MSTISNIVVFIKYEIEVLLILLEALTKKEREERKAKEEKERIRAKEEKKRKLQSTFVNSTFRGEVSIKYVTA